MIPGVYRVVFVIRGGNTPTQLQGVLSTIPCLEMDWLGTYHHTVTSLSEKRLSHRVGSYSTLMATR